MSIDTPTIPLTPAELSEIEHEHRAVESLRPYCRPCLERDPCRVRRLVAMARRVEGLEREHIWPLYHAVNTLLPTHRFVDGEIEQDAEYPASPEAVKEGQAIFRAHSACCGEIYDEGFRVAIAALTPTTEATDAATD